MASSTPLRHVKIDGGFFSESFILKIRDKPESLEETRWTSFGKDRQEFNVDYNSFWEWAKLTYDEISKEIDNWSIDERFSKWIEPLLQNINHHPEKTPSRPIEGPGGGLELDDYFDEEVDLLSKIHINFRMKNVLDPILQITRDEDFDERASFTYLEKSHHDHVQSHILLNSQRQWGILTNGKHFRLLGEYSNVYSKGYIEFDLENIIINRDEKEFRLFYNFFEATRFSQIFGLDELIWIENLIKKCKKEKIIINDEIGTEFSQFLNDLLVNADEKGVFSISVNNIELFLENLKENNIFIDPKLRSVLLKELEKIVNEINENKSVISRLLKKSQVYGVEVGKGLRYNVQKSLELMGQGFLDSNRDFAHKIAKGDLDIYNYYQELLRIAYRIIFVLYAENRDFLPDVTSVYFNEFSISSLRELAEKPIRDDPNTNLWERLLLLFSLLDSGQPQMGVNAFNGSFFSSDFIPYIMEYNLRISNSLVLRLIQSMTILETEDGLQRINYQEVNEEMIGGIYESLLDYQPRYMQEKTSNFRFILDPTLAERKGTGSYYTPAGAIDILLKTSLEPVVERKLSKAETKREKLHALLDLKICDTACGGGSFLLAALDYLGKKYAQIDTNQEFPDLSQLNLARRKILQNCIYGVDLNPLAIELAKVSLWLKALVKDTPLTFLDSHLKVGNSLIGFIKQENLKEIPKNAFSPIKGDKRTGVHDEIAKKAEIAKKGIGKFDKEKMFLDMFIEKTKGELDAEQIFKMPEKNIIDYKRKSKAYESLLVSDEMTRSNLINSIWQSAFFWPLSNESDIEAVNNTILIRTWRNLIDRNSKTIKEVERLKNKYNFFNWYLEFPEVFLRKDSGFDCILMNPPWEVLTVREVEFFSGKNNDVISASNKADRVKKIKIIRNEDPTLFKMYCDYYYSIKKQVHFFRNSKLYPLSTKGSFNLFGLFVERSRHLINDNGMIGAIVQSTLLTGKNLSPLFQNLIKNNAIESIFDFHNHYMIFPIGHRHHFTLITMTKGKKKEKPILSCFSAWDFSKLKTSLQLYENDQIEDEFLRRIDEGGSLFPITKDELILLNPNTKNCPMFRRRKDFEITTRIYRKFPVLIKRDQDGKIIDNPWRVNFKEIFHNQGDANLFTPKKNVLDKGARPFVSGYEGGIWIVEGNDKKEIYLPIYTGSAIWLYDHRFNDVHLKKDQTKKRKADYLRLTEEQHQDPNYRHIPLYWAESNKSMAKYPDNWKNKWFLCFRKITLPNNQRTFVISTIPNYPFIDSLTAIIFNEFRDEIICFLANLSSLIFDYLAKSKITGINFAHYNVEQLPIIPPDFYSKDMFDQIKNRVIELVYTSWDIQQFVTDFGIPSDQHPYKWDNNRRAKLIAELDAIFAILYNISKDELKYILDTFYVIRDNEYKEYGEFRTKRLVLEAFNSLKNEIL